jgi:uncharacterized circularly permuted ATP-grasp superfamily protein/uncharacterized alpha-E superfamily protein
VSDVGELLQQLLHDHLALTRRQVEADRMIAASLAGHLVHELPDAEGRRADRPWRLDPVPLILDGGTFGALAAAITERLVGMEALLADLYGPRRAVKDGWVPAEVLASSPRYRLAAVGTPPPVRWLTSYAVDVLRLADGSWRVVRDLADTPTGVGYAMIDRAVMARVAAELLGPQGAGDLASISGFPSELRHALAGASRVSSPRIVVFSGGISDPAYVEHSSLARLLGFHLVGAPDLVVRRGRLWLRTLGGLDPIDVVYRRLADGAIDPIEVSANNTTGVPGLLLAAAEGGVTLANAHGAGILEDPTVAPHWAPAIAALTGTTLRLQPLAPEDVAAAVPVFRDGQAGTAAAVIRLHAVAGPDGVTVMAGGNGRVLNDGDDPRRPTARLAKDVWVVGAARQRPVLVAPLPQVDLHSSVPTRAADAMFWLGRAAERAEAVAKAARVIASRRQTDPSLATFEGGRWARRMAHVLRVVRVAPPDAEVSRASPRASERRGSVSTDRPITVLDAELAAAFRAVGARLSAVLAEAATVGEYLSVTAGRVLGNLAASRAELADGVAAIDVLDETIADLATFIGLWDESTVHGPAWRFGDLGRRIERSLVVLGLVDACLGPLPASAAADEPAVDGPGADEPDVAVADEVAAADVVDRSALEVLLAANESLIAYRRHHRSDVELGAATHLLLHDIDNPRSFLACVHRMADHVAAIDWTDGRQTVARLAGIVDGDDVLDGVTEAGAAVEDFAALVVDTWFATPVNPMVVRGRLR